MPGLDLNGARVREELDRIASEGTRSAEATVDVEGVTAQASYTWKNGWGVVAWAQAKWRGEKNAGAKVSKSW